MTGIPRKLRIGSRFRGRGRLEKRGLGFGWRLYCQRISTPLLQHIIRRAAGKTTSVGQARRTMGREGGRGM